MNQKMKKWRLLFTAIVLLSIFTLKIFYDFAEIKIIEMGNNAEKIIKTNSHFIELQNIPFDKFKDYSNEIDHLLFDLTSKITKPFNTVIYNFLKVKTFSPLRQDMADTNIRSIFDLISYMKESVIKQIKNATIITSLFIFFICFILYILLSFHYKSDIKTKKLNDDALKNRKVLL